MKPFLTQYRSYFLTTLLSAGLLFSACSAVNNDVEELSEEDVEIAADIVASSLSDSESGLMSSVYDAFSTVDNEGISYGNGELNKTPDRDHSGRGREHSFSHTYDSTTGVHSINFERSVSNDRFSKAVQISQKIIYTDIEGEFMARPKANKSNMDAIAFTGSKSGQASNPWRSSSFTKIDTMNITGIHPSSGTLTMNGSHTGFGEAEGMLRDSSMASRAFEISIGFENIALDKQIVKANGNLEEGITGTLSYSIYMNRTVSGTPDEKLIEGTVDLQEDGTALLRFKKLSKVIRISLRDGEKTDRVNG
jgi:hypothetical protein